MAAPPWLGNNHSGDGHMLILSDKKETPSWGLLSWDYRQKGLFLAASARRAVNSSLSASFQDSSAATASR